MQTKDIDRIRRLEEWHIPPDVDYARLTGLRFEASQKLSKFRPATVGQASRVDGVTPADVAILLVHLEKAGRR
jgi:tRNA uridine 5-carboxymethylaminomethyl modification enzyme